MRYVFFFFFSSRRRHTRWPRDWSSDVCSSDLARGLLTRFSPGEPVAVWAGNGADWVLLEFAAALAGLTLVTVNPAYQAEELTHVLGHSGARGVFLRGGAQAEILTHVRGRLPRLREVITLGDWPSGDG